MSKEIEISFVEHPEENERTDKITQILSDGIYTFLKKNGFLKENPALTKKANALLEKTREITLSD